MLVTAPGARAVEVALLREIAGFVEDCGTDLSLLRRPVRIVVPSRSLREHLCSVLVRELGGSLAGVVVQTSFQLATEILETAGVALPAGEELLPVLVARSARAQPALRECLDDLAGGYTAVEAVVSDLLDAGFEPVHAEAVEELVVETSGMGSFGQRARAVVRVATEMAARIESGALAHRSARFRHARDEIERDPVRAFSARAVRVHGFADATGVQTDFIEALVRYRGARVYVDRPQDPGQPGRDDAGVAFSRRFRERMGGSAASSERSAEAVAGVAAEPGRACLRVLRAPGESAEVRAVASRIRELVDRGVTPERIGVVARDLARYRIPLRQNCARLGVPFSALGERGPLTAAGRRVRALLAVLRLSGAIPAERWLEAVERLAIAQDATPGEGGNDRPQLAPSAARPLSHTERADLRLALHHLGIARLADLTSFDLGARRARDGVFLPVRRGFLPDSDAEHSSPRRILPVALFRAAQEASARLGTRLARWPETATLGVHVARLLALVEEDLGWRAVESSAGELLAELSRSASLSAGEELDRDEFLLYAERALGAVGRVPLGGLGGGVQVLGVMEARARTFQHLFVLGMNRGVFPRPIVEDPLFSDNLRGRLRAVLPDLPVKAEGYDEERFLFAELLSASDDVVLSRISSDDAGKVQPGSSLLSRLHGVDGVCDVEDVPALFSNRRAEPVEGTGAGLRPAFEQAQIAGLYGTRRDFGEALPAALGEPWWNAGSGAENGGSALRSGIAAAEHGRARAAVLAEYDPGYGLRRALGPYFGFVGEACGSSDPRSAPLYITTVERVAECPWRAFLQRLLRLEASPDALGELPDADARLLGSVVHEVLERVVSSQLQNRVGTQQAAGKRISLEEVVAREPVGVGWPDRQALDVLLQECAAELARAQGIPLEGFGRVLAALARPYVETARECGWPAPGSGVGVLGAEVAGEVVVRDAAGAERSIRFLADRVDTAGDVLVLSDYKTGTPPGKQKTSGPRRKKHVEYVVQGSKLQSVAYALGASASTGREAEGRFIHLQPGLADDARVFSSHSGDEDFSEAFSNAAARILVAWDQGSFFPRLVEGEKRSEPRLCKYCDVKDACLRNDSGARRRLVSWVDDHSAEASGELESPGDAGLETAPESALLGIFDLRGGGA